MRDLLVLSKAYSNKVSSAAGVGPIDYNVKVCNFPSRGTGASLDIHQA